MRIMFAVPSFWPSQDGVANITGYLAKGLADKGHEIFIFTSAGNSGLQVLPEEEVYENMKIVRMRVETNWPLRLRGRDEKSTPAFYLQSIQGYQPDVLIVVCSQTWTLDWIMPHLNELSCTRVFYSHGYSKWKDKYDFLEKLKKRNIVGVWEQYLCKRYYDRLYTYLARFDLALYLTEQNNSNQYAKEHGLTNGKILENAIDDVFFEERMMHYYENTEKGIAYLFVANYGEYKNQEMLIRAFAKADIGRSRLVLVGFEENSYTDYLKKLIDELMTGQPDKKVELLTHLEREQVVELYRTCDIFTCPSKLESWSIVAHEAAATAMPIISTDVGIYHEIDGAYIVEDENSMQAAMEELYKNPEERRRRGLLARAWVQGRNCRIADKVDWLEQELLQLTYGRNL